MKVLFENQNTAQETYSAIKHKPETTIHRGCTYIKIGKSYKKLESTLSQIIKLIGIIALSIFLIGIPFTFPSVRKTLKNLYKEITDKREKTIHYIPNTEKLGAQHQAIYKTSCLFKNILSSMPINVQQIKVLINLEFELDSIKKEFIVKHDIDHQLITFQFFKDIINKILNYLEKDVAVYIGDHQVGPFQKTACTVIFKDQNNHFRPVCTTYCQSNEITINDLNKYDSQQLNAIASLIFNSVKFAPENLLQHTDFIPGTFYHDLDAVPVQEIV